MFKLAKEVTDTSNTLWEAAKNLVEHIHEAFRNRFHSLSHKSEKSLDQLNDKRVDLREDLYW